MEPRTGPALAPETVREVEEAAERPSGVGAAVILASGVGTFVLGLFTTLAVVSESFKDFLAFTDDVGPLAGKTIFGAGAFFAVWGILHGLWHDKNPPWRPVLLAAGILLVLGLIGTFPTFFEAFEAE